MRFAVRVLACVSASAISLALADPSTTSPDTTAAPPAAPATAATPAPSAAQATPAAATAPAKPAVDPQEKLLIAMGYRAEMRNGEKVFCRHEQVLGSRISVKKHCGTVAQLRSEQAATRDEMEKIQRNQSNPMGK